MLKKRLLGAALAVAMVGSLSPTAYARSGSPDVVIEWNQLLQTWVPGTLGLQTPKYFAMLHVAIFDAINSIERGYSPYYTKVSVQASASSEAAAAQAAHDVLVALIPSATSAFDTALANRLAGIPEPSKSQGIQAGTQVAMDVLNWRTNDGWEVPPPAYVLPPLPGLWQPTPPGNLAATFTQFPGVKPFALLTPTQFLPPRQPELTSEQYAKDVNEVKEIGSVSSTTRTPEQTQLALLWAGVISRTGLFAIWNNIARDAAIGQGSDLIETARMYVLLNVSINDGLQTSYSSKFTYGLWRPVTAIRRAAEDLNPATEPDTGWLPLLITPPYPSHAGNMACVGASAATALALNFGTDDIPVTAKWLGNATNPDVSVDFDGFWAVAVSQALSRVHGGIHYTFEETASQQACPKVAMFVYKNYMRPR
jgi:hypothetical protein